MRDFIVPVLVTLALSACTRSEANPAPKQAAHGVRVATIVATEAATRDTLTLTGELAADQRSDITADTQGRVLAVLARRGQHVKRGEPLIRLDVRTAALSTREAHANLAAAKSDEQLAETECGRSSSLYQKGAITKSEADREAAHCASATQKVAAAEARAALLANGISDGIVRAPFDGVVAAKNVAIGEWVAPGRSLVTLVDDGALRVELAVPEAQIGAVKLGQAVELTTVSRAGTYRAVVTRLGAEIGKSRALTVEATVDPTPDLLPGMFVAAQVVIGASPRPIVPATAVAKRGKQWHAFVVRDGVVEDRIIKLGPQPDASHVSVARGLTKNDRVVGAVTDQIIDGLRVE